MIIYHLPPIKGTRYSCWTEIFLQTVSFSQCPLNFRGLQGLDPQQPGGVSWGGIGPYPVVFCGIIGLYPRRDSSRKWLTVDFRSDNPWATWDYASMKVPFWLILPVELNWLESLLNQQSIEARYHYETICRFPTAHKMPFKSLNPPKKRSLALLFASGSELDWLKLPVTTEIQRLILRDRTFCATSTLCHVLKLPLAAVFVFLYISKNAGLQVRSIIRINVFVPW